MICPVCDTDCQRVKLPWHLVEDHHWPADRAETYYQQQIRRLLEGMK